MGETRIAMQIVVIALLKPDIIHVEADLVAYLMYLLL